MAERVGFEHSPATDSMQVVDSTMRKMSRLRCSGGFIVQNRVQSGIATSDADRYLIPTQSFARLLTCVSALIRWRCQPVARNVNDCEVIMDYFHLHYPSVDFLVGRLKHIFAKAA